MRDWSDIPYDIWRVIADNISFLPDLYQFASACVEWRKIAEEICGSFPSRHPLLMLPYDGESQTCKFVDISNDVVHHRRLPELVDRWICGASDGWLIMLDNQLKIEIFNPYSRAKLRLPQHPMIDTCTHVTPSSPLRMRDHYMQKIVLSGSPASNSECYAAAIVSAWMKLAICKVGDDKWTTIGTQQNQYLDVTFYKGKVVAARYISHPLVVFDVHCPTEIRMIQSPEHTYPKPEYCSQQYVVESSGDLLLVLRIRSYRSKRKQFYKTYRFHVYKLSEDMKGWSKVENLGDCSLFVGCNRSMSVNVRAGSISGCRPNCIYYIDDYLDGIGEDGVGGQTDCGVFSLEDGSNDFLPPHAHRFWPSPGFWCMQSL